MKFLDLADFTLQEQPKDNLMVTTSHWHGIMAHIPWLISQSLPGVGIMQ